MKKSAGMHILDRQSQLIVGYYDNRLKEENSGQGKWYTQAQHVDSLTAFETFDFVANGRVRDAQYLTGMNRVLIQADGPGYREFIIFHTHREDGVVEVKANGSHADMNKDKEPIPPTSMLSASPEQVAAFACDGTEFVPGIIEYAPFQDVITEEYMGGYEFAKFAAEKLDMELQFRVEVEGNRVVGRYMDMLVRVGENRGKEIVVGKDLIGLTVEEMSGDVVSALVVQGPEDENGDRITVVVEDNEAKARWGKDGGHVWGYHEVQSENRQMTQDEVEMYGRRELNKRVAAIVKYTATAAAIEHIFGREHEKVYKGDEVRLKNTDYDPPLYMEARVFEVTRDPTRPSAKTYELGDVILLEPDAVRNTLRLLQKELREKIDRGEVIDAINDAQIIKSVLPPADPVLNALWLDIGRIPNVLYRWDGDEWIKSTATVPSDIGAETPEQVQARVNAMRDTLRGEITEVGDALGDFEDTINTTFKDGIIEEAEAKAIEKYKNTLNAEKADVDAKFGQVYTNLYLTGTPESNLNNSKNDYDTAHANLINSVNAAIADGKTTATEKADVDAKFGPYRTTLATFSERMEQALQAIGTAQIATLDIGSRNYQKDIQQTFQTAFTTATPVGENGMDLVFLGNSGTSPYIFLNPIEADVIEIGKQHTITFQVTSKHDAAFSLRFGLRNGGFSDQNQTLQPGQTMVLSRTFEPWNNQSLRMILFTPAGTTDIPVLIEKMRINKGNKSLDWQPAPEDLVKESKDYADGLKQTLDQELGDLSDALGDFETEINTTFKDGIIEEAEAKSIEKYKNSLVKEKGEADSQYTIVYNHAMLSGTAKTNLASAKTTLNTAHTNLINSINAAIADGKTTAAEKADVDSKFGLYTNAFSTLATRLEEAFTFINEKLAEAAEGRANSYADGLKQTIDQTINDLTGDLSDFQDTVNTTFKDGIIEQAEAKAIEKYKNQLNAAKGGADAQYSAIYGNVFLSGTPKTNLASAKTAFNTAHNNLITAVNDAIADGRTTAAEKTLVDTRFTTYNSALGTLSTRFDQAVDEITRARAASEGSKKAEVAKYQMELGQIADAQRELGVEVTELNQNDWLQSNPVLTSLNSRQSTFNARANELYSLIQNAIADETLTAVELNNIAAKRTEYRSAMDLLIKEIKLAEAEVIRVSANEVMAYGEKKIYRGSQIPTDAVALDLWLDSRSSPPVWRQYIGGTWQKVTRTEISDLGGQITETQIADDFIKTPMLAANAITSKHIAANQIDSTMITTAGLDAGVITYGTMTGVTSDVGQAGMTAQGTVGTSTRFWAGAVYANRNTAPFRVTQAGAVYSSDMTVTGGMIRGASAEFGGPNGQYGSVTVLDQEGELATELRGDIAGFDRLNVGYLYAPNKVEYADFTLNKLTLYVASSPTSSGGAEPSDDNGGTGWSDAIKSMGEALRRIPKNFDGEVELLVAYGQEFNELVEIQGFGGGGILMINNSLTYSYATVVGGLRIINNSIRVEWRRVNIDSTQDYAGIFCQNGTGLFADVYVNGASGNTSFGVNVNSGGSFEFYRCQFTNISTAVRASYGGQAFVSSCTGYGSQFGLQGFGGGNVAGTGTAPTGGSANIGQTQGGTVNGTWTFPTPPAPPATRPVATTTKWGSTDAGSYRFDEGRWDIYGSSVNRPTQGSWSGYGPFQGSWFFGSGLSNTVSGKTIKSIRVYIKRTTGGSSSSVSVRIKPHTSATRPSGNVSKQSPNVSVGFRVGEGKWVTLPSSFYAGFQSGSYKGITIDGTAYMKFEQSATVEIRYE